MDEKYTPLGFMKENVPKGSHIIFLYENEIDLLKIFPPFFAAGLKNNEFCLVIYPTLGLKQKIIERLERLVELERYINEKKIEFVYYKDFYFKNNIFCHEKVFEIIEKKLNIVEFGGVDGIRGAGDMSWVEDDLFKKVLVYEKGITEKYSKMEVLILCAYPVRKLSIPDLVDVLQSHMLVLYKKDKKWCLSETVERKVLMREINNLERFTRVAVDRELKMVKLKKKISELKENKA